MIQVGVIGLGIMGGAIARHLVADGVAVAGLDKDAGACARAAQDGVRIVSDVAALVGAVSGPIILSLDSAAAVMSVAKDIAGSGSAPRTVVEMSTLGLAQKHGAHEVLSSAGHDLLDCPISGTGAQMASKDVVIYASGTSKAVNDLLDVFSRFSRRTIYLGEFGTGTVMKLVANHLVAIHNVAAAEAMMLGMAGGIAPELLIEAVQAGAATSRIFELRAPLIAADRYTPPTMKLSVWDKDMAAIADFAADLGAATPLLDTVAPLYKAALREGLGELDTAAVAKVLGAQRTKGEPDGSERR